MLRFTVRVTHADLLPPDNVLAEAGARGVSNLIVRHLRARSSNRRGFPSSGYWADAADSVSVRPGSGNSAAVDAILAQTADAVRGFVRAGGRKVPTDAGLVPPSLVPFAYDFATFRVLKRFNVPVGEDRRKAYDAAMDVFKKVAAGDMAVEPADDAEDATSATLPSFIPANPERRLG